MPNTLIIDTSSAYCSLAAATAHGRVEVVHEHLGRRHNEALLPLLDKLMRSCELAVADLEVVGFGCGPGSFTGVRIAASAIQAIAAVSQARVVPLSGPEMLALSAPQDVHALRVSVIHSRADAYYIAAFTRQDSHTTPWHMTHPAQLCSQPPEWWPEVVAQGTSVAGPQPDWMATAEFPSSWHVDAVPDAQMALGVVQARYALGMAVEAAEALPVYLAADSPWQKVVPA